MTGELKDAWEDLMPESLAELPPEILVTRAVRILTKVDGKEARPATVPQVVESLDGRLEPRTVRNTIDALFDRGWLRARRSTTAPFFTGIVMSGEAEDWADFVVHETSSIAA